MRVRKHAQADHAILPLHFVQGQDKLLRLAFGVAQVVGVVEGGFISRGASGVVGVLWRFQTFLIINRWVASY
jgi:hypothetical protein